MCSSTAVPRDVLITDQGKLIISQQPIMTTGNCHGDSLSTIKAAVVFATFISPMGWPLAAPGR